MDAPIDERMAPRPPRWFYVVAVLLGIGLGVAGGWIALRLAGQDPRALAWRALVALHVTRVVGLHQPDPVIGYVHVPTAEFHHQTALFDVTYHMDARGARLTPGSDHAGPIVQMLGDSWTFGHGVTDDETYAAVLQRTAWPDASVRNRGVMGYGTVHSLLQLERALDSEDPPALVTYGWLWFHAPRSARRRSTLAATSLHQVPWFELVGGELLYKGLAGMDQAIPDDPEPISEAEWALTRAAIRKMRDVAAAKGARFTVLLLPSTSADQAQRDGAAKLAPMLRADGVDFLDIAHDPEFPNADDLYYPVDGHPRAEWHRRLAEYIAGHVALGR
jgi:hypothetical protein